MNLRFFGSFLILPSIIGALGARAQEASPEAPPAEAAKDEALPTMPTLADFVTAGAAHAAANLEAEAIIGQREREHEQAILGLLPVLSANAAYTRNQTEASVSIPDATGQVTSIVITPQNQLDFTVRLDATLVDVGAFYGIGSASLRVESAQLSKQATELDVEREVTQAYWQRVAAEAVVRSAERSIAVAIENRRVVAVRKEADLASELDLDRADSAIARAKQTLADATLSKSLAARKLRTLTGLAADGAAPTFEAKLEPAAPLQSLEDRAANTPSVLLAAKNVESAEASETVSWLGLVPRISASAQERFTNAAGFGPSPVYSIALQAEWRLDPAVIGRSRTEGATLKVAQASHARAVSAANAAIEDAWLEVESRTEAVRSARSEALTATRAAANAKLLYQANKASQLEVITADRDALAAEVNRIQAEANLELSRALLLLAQRQGTAP